MRPLSVEFDSLCYRCQYNTNNIAKQLQTTLLRNGLIAYTSFSSFWVAFKASLIIVDIGVFLLFFFINGVTMLLKVFLSLIRQADTFSPVKICDSNSLVLVVALDHSSSGPVIHCNHICVPFVGCSCCFLKYILRVKLQTMVYWLTLGRWLKVK